MPAATLHCMLALNNTRQAQLESGGGDGGHGGLLGLASMRLDEQETKRQDESLYQERSQERSSPLSRLPGVAPGSPSSPRRAPFSSVDALLSSLSEFERLNMQYENMNEMLLPCFDPRCFACHVPAWSIGLSCCHLNTASPYLRSCYG